MKKDIIDEVFLIITKLMQNVDESILLKAEKEIRQIHGGCRPYVGTWERKKKRIALKAAILDINSGASLFEACAKYKISAPYIRKYRNKVPCK